MAKTKNGGGSLPRITKRVSDLIDALVQGDATSAEEAGKIAGMSRRNAFDALKRPHVQQEMERRIRQRLSGVAFPRAAHVAALLLEANSEYVKADMAKHILGIHGVKPTPETAPAAASGFVYRLVINGQELAIGAAVVPLADGHSADLGRSAQDIGHPAVARDGLPTLLPTRSPTDRDKGAPGS